jgi:hypothetical protein
MWPATLLFPSFLCFSAAMIVSCYPSSTSSALFLPSHNARACFRRVYVALSSTIIIFFAIFFCHAASASVLTSFLLLSLMRVLLQCPYVCASRCRCVSLHSDRIFPLAAVCLCAPISVHVSTTTHDDASVL